VWLKNLARACRNPLIKDGRHSHDPHSRAAALDAYTDAHLGFVSIHPYAHGNGRMALASNWFSGSHATDWPVAIRGQAQRLPVSLRSQSYQASFPHLSHHPRP